MKTYLKVLFNAEGARPSQVNSALMGLGFSPTKGPYDWEYPWSEEAPVDDILDFGDHIHAALEGLGCLYELETV